MTLSTQTNSQSFTASEGQTAFQIPFPFLDNSHVSAVTIIGGSETTLTEGPDYGLTGAEGSGDPRTLTLTTGLSAGDTLVVARTVPLTQETDLPNSGPFLASNVEQAFDYGVMIDQQLQADHARAITVPERDPSIGNLELPSDRADKVLAFDSSGHATAKTAEEALGVTSDFMKVDAAGAGLDATPRTFQDNAGTATPISISTGNIKVAGAGDPDLIHTSHANDRVGVGTTTPDGKLHVHAASAGTVTAEAAMSTLVVEDNGEAGMTFLTPNNVSTHIAFGDPQDADAGRITYDHAQDEMAFLTNGSERLRIDNAGKVGVGTNNPISNLHVVTSGVDATAIFESTDDGAAAGPDIVMSRASSSPDAGDNLAHLNWLGHNVSQQDISYVDMVGVINDAGVSQETGRLKMRTALNGVMTTVMELDGGNLDLPNLPTSADGLAADTVWNANGQLAIGAQTVDKAGFRNHILNGDMRIAQRGTSISLGNAEAETKYTLDRWVIYTGAGGEATVTQEDSDFEDPTGDRNFMLRWDQTVAGATFTPTIRTLIENVRTLAGQSVTISFDAKVAAGTLSLTPSLQQNFGSGGSPTAQKNQSASAVTVTTTKQRFSTTIALDAITSGDTIGTTKGTDYLQLVLAAPTGETWTLDITNVQMEAGTVATSFEKRPEAIEELLCRRFFERRTRTAVNNELIANGLCVHGTGAHYSLPFLVPKRATPMVAIPNTTDFTVFHGNTSQASTSMSATSIGDEGCKILVNVASGLTAGEATLLAFTNTNGSIDIEAEF